MAGTAQTGLGPRTVALSLKVFIVVMLYAHERLGICNAQPGETLPAALKLVQLREHFCTAGCARESRRLDCGHDQLSANPLCLQICNSGSCNSNCWNKASTSLCKGNQTRICGYSNADVCQNNNGDRTRICVYTNYSSPAFCICQPEPSKPYTSCAEVQASTAQATTAKATAAQLATTSQVARAQADATRGSAANQPTNVVGIVFGSLFALLLLFVIIGAVILCLLIRKRRLPSFMKQPRNPADLSNVEREARNSTRALPPEPLVPGTSMDYSVAYDHIPANPGVMEDPSRVETTYCSVGEDSHREGSPRYVLDGQRKKTPTEELDTATDNAKDHPYFVLNGVDGESETRNENGGGHADEGEVTDSPTGVQSKEAIETVYTPLVQAGDPTSRAEQFGNEVAASPTSSKVTSPIVSPTEGLSNGDAGTYFPLILSAEPKSHVEQSGYEDAKIPTSESHNATSPTGAQSISGDEDTYTPLIQTAEPKSQNKLSEYEIPIIPESSLAADSDVTSPYDHLDRKSGTKPKKGALSTTDVDDYQQLVKKQVESPELVT